MKPIEKFLKNFDEQFKKAKFKNIKADKSNINEIYENNISIWYYFNSDKVKKKDGTKEINSKLDTINHVILKNPENFIFCKTKDGFSLTESDFINSELSIINTIENFSISEKKQFDFYKNYLLNKLEQHQKTENKNQLFIKKYQSDNWYKYENESILFKTSTEKINYWSNKLLEYQKDKINLDYLGTAMLTLDVNLKEPKHLNGFLFDEFCQKNIDLLKLENQIYKPQQTENKKPDEVKKELHPEIFKDNYFEVWQKMYDAFEIKESSYNKNLEFMYNVMFDKGFINKNIGKKDMVNWINDIYQITFTKIRYTNYKENSNKARLIIFNEILENSKGTKHT